jgi:outer membrane protein assembly factor BamA
MLVGCPARILQGRLQVRQVNLRGVTQVDEEGLRSRLAVRETSQFPANRPQWLRWWRWWWRDPEYFDETSVMRDRLRIRRYYQARGFYEADVTAPRLLTEGAQLTIDFSVNEGLPTVVADVRLRGCEPNETPVLPGDGCRIVRERITMRPGQRFDEGTFGYDREQVLDFTREAGFATPTVISRAAVDPHQRLAWVEYTIRPGPRSTFGDVRLFPAASARDAITTGELPGGLPARAVLSAMGIDRGQPYSRNALARAQQALFDLGVFGIARIEERPRADGVVDLDVSLSSARLWRFRVGIGAEADNSRTIARTPIAFEHRNFLGGMRRLRVDVRPQLFLPPVLSGGAGGFDWTLGLAASAELQQPEISTRTTGFLSANFDRGPDPVNPQVGYRQALRVGLGLEARLLREVTGAFFVRTTNVG